MSRGFGLFFYLFALSTIYTSGCHYGTLSKPQEVYRSAEHQSIVHCLSSIVYRPLSTVYDQSILGSVRVLPPVLRRRMVKGLSACCHLPTASVRMSSAVCHELGSLRAKLATLS